MRNALVVADTGGSSAFLPYFELFGTFPASLLLTWGLSRLMRVFSFRFIFPATTLFFLLFFATFALWIYPHREATLVAPTLPSLSLLITHWPDMTFCVMSELWKVALLSVLFWGFINQSVSLEEAKRLYPPLMLGSSLGTILSGPITLLCTSDFAWRLFALSSEKWQHALYGLTLFLLLFGFASLFLFDALFEKLKGAQIKKEDELPQEKVRFSRRLLSLSSSFKYLLKSPYLGALLLIVVAEYVSYALGELIFLENLKKMYPTPTAYCQYMGSLTSWTGILTAFSALFLAPYLLQTYRWSYSALLTPLLMVLMTVAFFVVLIGSFPLPWIVALGSLHFCIGRSIKYTVFDATKELAFIPLDPEGQVKGKLIVDGVGSRLGRGTSSFLSLALFTFVGGPIESALFAGILASCFALLSVPLARFLGKEFEKMTPQTINGQGLGS